MMSVNKLTKQEAIVLALLVNGRRNTEIASELVISIKTVETHLSRIYEKLGVSSRTQAAIYAVQNLSLMNGENQGNP